MRAYRAISLASGVAVAAVVAAMVIAVPLGMIVDRGPSGAARLTAFPLALTVSDEVSRGSIRNSMILAGTVAAASLVIGVGLARLIASARFPGRDALVALANAPGAVPPLFAAIGLAALGRAMAIDGDARWRWLALAWVELAWGVPRVMSAAMSAFGRVSPAWLDAARLAGAGRTRAWWSIVWPLARPGVARAVAGVVLLTLFEPGGPLVLGVRDTLASRIVDAALDSDRLSRAAALGTLGLAIGVIARTLLLWWGGPAWPDESLPHARPPRRSSWAGIVAATLGLLTWAAIGLIPAVAILGEALGLDRGGRVTLAPLRAIASDPLALAFLGHGLLLGLAATIIAGLFASASGRPSRRNPARLTGVVPPLAIGLGAVILPYLLSSPAGPLASRASFLASTLRGLPDLLDPYAWPWVVLVVAVALPRWPELRRAFAYARAIDDGPRIDVARSLGATRFQAWRDVSMPRLAPILGGAIAWSISTSALDAGPALLLSPTLSARPIGPGLLTLIALPDGDRRAAALAAVALLLPLAAWIVGGSRSHDAGEREPSEA